MPRYAVAVAVAVVGAGLCVVAALLLLLYYACPNLFMARGNTIVYKVSDSWWGYRRWEPSDFSRPADYARFWRARTGRLRDEIVKLGIGPDDAYGDAAVIHFRCSDVPFVKHPSYYLLPRAFYTFVAGRIRDAGIRRVVVITCPEHRKHALADAQCPLYTETITAWLRDALPPGVTVDVDASCMTRDDTYAAFLGSQLLVSTGGSFSFVPGLTKGKRFVTPSLLALGAVPPAMRDLHTHVHWTMWDNVDDVIPHATTDYATFDYAARDLV